MKGKYLKKRHNVSLDDRQWSILVEESKRSGIGSVSGVIQRYAGRLERKHLRQDCASDVKG